MSNIVKCKLLSCNKDHIMEMSIRLTTTSSLTVSWSCLTYPHFNVISGGSWQCCAEPWMHVDVFCLENDCFQSKYTRTVCLPDVFLEYLLQFIYYSSSLDCNAAMSPSTLKTNCNVIILYMIDNSWSVSLLLLCSFYILPTSYLIVALSTGRSLRLPTSYL